jgi:hypothetical protein
MSMTWTIERSQRPDIKGNPWQVKINGDALEIFALEMVTGPNGERIPIEIATDRQISDWADRVRTWREAHRQA